MENTTLLQKTSIHMAMYYSLETACDLSPKSKGQEERGADTQRRQREKEGAQLIQSLHVPARMIESQLYS